MFFAIWRFDKKILLNNNTSRSRSLTESSADHRDVAQGDYDARRTKVVHLKVNPASEQRHLRATELQRLRSDNERLIQRVRLLAEAPGGSTDTPLADLTVVVEQRLNEGTSSREIEGERSPPADYCTR